ncbi:hypothetical protein PFISCL1PPCAC_18994, partial [Pristionchus fissidentatus]
MSMEFATIICFTKLRNLNEKKLEQEKQFNLSERYQISENVRMLRLLLPVVWSHTIITVFAAFAFIVYTVLQMAPVYDPIYEDTIQFIHLQSILMPICFYVQYRRALHRNAEMMSTNRDHGETHVMIHYENIQ